MRDKITYEWALEELDPTMIGEPDPDIVDTDHADTIGPGCHWDEQIDSRTHRIALVRSIGNQDDGLKSRAYAYLVHAGPFFYLPEEFDDGATVPQRFFRELKRSNIQPSFIILRRNQ